MMEVREMKYEDLKDVLEVEASAMKGFPGYIGDANITVSSSVNLTNLSYPLIIRFILENGFSRSSEIIITAFLSSVLNIFPILFLSKSI